jgi:hypothetical protein
MARNASRNEASLKLKLPASSLLGNRKGRDGKDKTSLWARIGAAWGHENGASDWAWLSSAGYIDGYIRKQPLEK